MPAATAESCGSISSSRSCCTSGVRILAVDTATAATSVAFWDQTGSPLEARDDPPPGRRPGHATRLLPLAVELLGDAGIGWEELDRIAVGTGPGTFTGLRIGIATARALARGAGIPLVGISTLQSLAAAAQAHPDAAQVDAVLAVLDARRGEVFAAAWWHGEAAVPDDAAAQRALLAPRAYAPEMLATVIEQLGLPALAIGGGAVEFREVLERSGAVIPEDDSELHSVSAASHCRLACELRATVRDEVLPEYLRLPDAEIARRATRMP